VLAQVGSLVAAPPPGSDEGKVTALRGLIALRRNDTDSAREAAVTLSRMDREEALFDGAGCWPPWECRENHAPRCHAPGAFVSTPFFPPSIR